MKSLHLHVKTIYFDAIKSGAKTEEYRIVNDYWIRRLATGDMQPYQPQHYDSVVIWNAYKSGTDNRIERPWRGWTIKNLTHPHFGLKEVTVFAIQL